MGVVYAARGKRLDCCQLYEAEKTDDGLVMAMELVPILIVVTTRDHPRPQGFALEAR